MAHPDVVSREEWLAARRELLRAEKELTKARDELNARRRDLPMVRVDQDYVFDGPAGKVRLDDLFEGRDQLIVYHFMFDPQWDSGCPRCTHFVNDLGHLPHLHDRNTSFAVVSRAPIGKIEAYRRQMGWDVPWYSSHGTDFNYDYGVTMDASVTPPRYNFRSAEDHERAGMPWYTEGEQPGVSVFLRVDGEIHHTYSAYARGLDILSFSRNFLDLTPLGRQDG